MFGINIYVCIFVVAGLAGLYTIVGGLLAVMITESIQTVILLIGAISILLIGLHKIGGWAELQACIHPVNFSVIRSASIRPAFPNGPFSWAILSSGYGIGAAIR